MFLEKMKKVSSSFKTANTPSLRFGKALLSLSVTILLTALMANPCMAKAKGIYSVPHNPTAVAIKEPGETYSEEEIATLAPKKFRKALHKIEKPKPAYPDEYAKWRVESLIDETGTIARNGLVNAINHVNQMEPPPSREIWGQHPMDPDDNSPTAAGIYKTPWTWSEPGNIDGHLRSGIDQDSWTWLGPGNIGGRIRSCVIHPTNPDIMWVGSIAGGIWKTANGGATWTQVDDFMANLAVCAMVMDPTDSDIMYAGTGEGFYNDDAIRGAGVFKSTDGGVTWNHLASTAGSDWYWVNRLAINSDASVLLAATRSGIYRSVDDGSTWTQVYSLEVLDVKFDPNDNNKAIAGNSSGWYHYSTDSGQTWTNTLGFIATGRVELAYAPSDSAIVYASVEQLFGTLHKSTDGGVSYSMVNTGSNYLGDQGSYDNIIWVDPTDANTVIVGGIDLWRSTDGGVSLTKISAWQDSPLSAHADHHFIIEHPDFDGTANKTVFFCNDGGIYKTDDVYTVIGTTGWQELNNNLGITQFYGAAGNPASGVIIGGTQDNGTLRYAGATETWTEMSGGDGGYCAFDQNDSNYAYGEYVYLQIHRSTNGGASSSFIYSGISDAGSSSTAELIAPFVLDPNNQSVMLAGGTSLWKTSDVKAATVSWGTIKNSIGSTITAIAVAQGNSDIIWIGHDNGDVYKTGNGTSAPPTWTQVDTGTPNLPNRRCQRITIDPNDHNLVYVTFGGFSADNVYRTTDGGSTWSDITGSGATGLPDAPVRSLVIYPQNSDWLYVGTEVGIFASEDGGANWSTTNDGPTNCSVDELFWMANNTLVAATHGRGLFKIRVGPKINLKQGATDIAAGGSYDFGGKTIGTDSDTIFTIKNTGATDLKLITPLTISGADADQFSIEADPASPVGAGNSATFTVRFSPASEGVKTATIGITHNDSDENPYDLNLKGTGIPAPDSPPVPTVVTGIPAPDPPPVPTVINVTSLTESGSYTVGSVITITVRFSHQIWVKGTPQLVLRTGTTPGTAYYNTGSGTNILTFLYTVTVGEDISVLDYWSEWSLELNDGQIYSNLGIDADLTLPAPGTPGSLGYNMVLGILGNVYPVYRFYSSGLLKHLFTTDENEKEHLIANAADVWNYEGVAYYAYLQQQYNEASRLQRNTLKAVHRFYSEDLQTHLFTLDENEKNHLIETASDVWRYEGPAFYVPSGYQQDSRAVYRFYSEQLKVHFYTMDENEKDTIIATFPEDVWRYEGIAYYAYP
ncbi:choice-of-anchor D domain-containing protein [Desulfococcaceae bacterium HSG9]|nr:choice-of-anchor D domain-containing protein [Desulfococcaceae bacterium HSG9]